MKHSVKRVAAIHDLSGFGRASLTAIIPILSSMGLYRLYAGLYRSLERAKYRF